MKCLSCGKEIIKMGARQGEHFQAIEPGQSHLFEQKDGDSFVRCPACKARNILIDVPTPAGQGQNQKFGRFDFK